MIFNMVEPTKADDSQLLWVNLNYFGHKTVASPEITISFF